VKLAEQTSFANAGAKISFVVVPHPVAGVGRAAAMSKAEKAWPDLLKAATKWTPPAVNKKALKQQAAYPASTFTFKGTTAQVSQMFIDKGWSEGIPIVPPTPEKVAAMLKGTTRKPDEVVWVVPPINGILTVEEVAVNAVMAGCKPSYMPVILGALDGLKDPSLNWRALTTTTHPDGILAVVNGPRVKKLGLAGGTGAAGGTYQANTSIGYALSLITDIVGGSKPPIQDKSTLGWSGNTISTVVAENVGDSPWSSYSSDKGYSKNDSTVTVYAGGPPVNMDDHSSPTTAGILRTIANSVSYAGQNSTCGVDSDVVILLNPEFAKEFSDAGYTKEKLKVWLWENARRPAGDYPDTCSAFASKSLGIPVNNNTLIPTVSNPDHFQIIVVGGPGRHAQYWPAFKYWLNPSLQDKTVITVKVKD